MTDKQKIIKENYILIGRKGGKKCLEKHGREYFVELAKKSNEAKKKKKLLTGEYIDSEQVVE